MPTPLFVCGAECGLEGPGASAGGTAHWVVRNGTPTNVTSGPSSMRSARCLRFSPVGTLANLQHTFATAIASPATLVLRMYINFATLPNADVRIFQAPVGANLSVMFKQSDSTLRAGGAAVTNFAASGKVVTTGVWYRLDIKAVNGTTNTVDLSVDGVAQAQYSLGGQSGGQIANFNIGTTNTGTSTFYVDDIVVSGTAADFPIGASTVAGLYANGDGTHGGTWAAGVFGKGAGGLTNASRTDTDIWQSLAKPLSTSAGTNWVADNLGVLASDYVAFGVDDLPAAISVNGAMLTVTARGSTSTGCNIGFSVGATALLNSLGMAVATIAVFCVARNTDAAGTAWTPSTVNAMECRFWSTDSAPDVYLHGFVWEVDYIPATGRGKVWSGSAWVQKPLKVWSGSAWVEKPVKVWTGSAWKVVG